MKVESLVNNKFVTLVLVPENTLEEEILKQVANQKNTVIQLDSSMAAGMKTVRNGLVIGEGLSDRGVDTSHDS